MLVLLWHFVLGRAQACLAAFLPGRVIRRCWLPVLLQGVTSRDIKLENTLLDGGQWPLIKVGRTLWDVGKP